MSGARLVHLVDDDEAVRTALGELLVVCGYAVRPYASGDALLDAADRLADGCILLDLRMPGRSGLEVQEELLRRGIELPVIFLTAHGDVPTGVAAMKRGASDFLQKPVREEPLLEALEQAFARHESGSGERAVARATRDRIATLTAREREVVELVVSGLRNREIAQRLGIALPTVKVHRMRGMAKLQAETVQQLVHAWRAAQGGA
jgi:FixJ family two-component response regulator